MTDAGSLLHLNARHSFRQATERLNGLARSVPNDKDDLAEDQVLRLTRVEANIDS